MGFWSFKTSDTNESVSNRYSSRGAKTAHLLSPTGEVFTEENYEGYGMFGGKDAFELLLELNDPEEVTEDMYDNRDKGAGLFYMYEQGTLELAYPIKIVSDPTLKYEDVEPSVICPDQGYFY